MAAFFLTGGAFGCNLKQKEGRYAWVTILNSTGCPVTVKTVFCLKKLGDGCKADFLLKLRGFKTKGYLVQGSANCKVPLGWEYVELIGQPKRSAGVVEGGK